MDPDRERLRELSRRLAELHRLLLDRERAEYERRHGAIPSGRMLQLVLNDAHFAWLRELSSAMARIDEAVDADDPITARDVEAAFREVHRLLKSADTDTFQEKYRDALQESPDVVMAHAAISEVLRGPGGRR